MSRSVKSTSVSVAFVSKVKLVIRPVIVITVMLPIDNVSDIQEHCLGFKISYKKKIDFELAIGIGIFGVI